MEISVGLLVHQQGRGMVLIMNCGLRKEGGGLVGNTANQSDISL